MAETRCRARAELWVVVTAFLAMTACEPRDQTPVGRGGRVFQRTCSGCHGPDGRGVMRLGLAKPPRDLTNADFHAHVTDDQLRSVIRTGKGQMPAFGGLMGDDDLNDVIAYIRTLPPGARAPAAAPPGAAVPPAAAPPPAAVPPAPVPSTAVPPADVPSAATPEISPSALVTPEPQHEGAVR
jgi:mono/diheme cytochrome c family protein